METRYPEKKKKQFGGHCQLIGFLGLLSIRKNNRPNRDRYVKVGQEMGQ